MDPPPAAASWRPVAAPPRPPGGGGAPPLDLPPLPDEHGYHVYRARPQIGGGLRTGLPGRWRPRLPRRITPLRVLAALIGLFVAWIALSVVLFLVSSHFNRIAPPADVAAQLDPSGSPLFSAQNILVLGSDQRPKGTHEAGASTQVSRSDVMLLIRTGAGHSARLSIPRDTIVPIPGHGMQKINAAYAFGGPALAIATVKRFLGVPVNHVVIVNFESFPDLVDSMGGVTYKGGCVISYINGGFRNGGYTLRLTAGTHHLDGKQALALARTRHNLCAPNQDDINREQHQQALFTDMEHALTSPSILTHLPWVAWSAPPAITSDMSGETLIQLFGALAIGGSTPTRLLMPTGVATLPDGEQGLTITQSALRADVARFEKG